MLTVRQANIDEFNKVVSFYNDLIDGIPAAKLYPSVGFEYIDCIKLFYEDVGLTDFYLYEYVL